MGFNLHGGVLLPNKPVPKYRYMDLPKTDDNYRTHKNDANILSWHIVSMLLSLDKCLIGAIEFTCFGISKAMC